MLWSLSAGFWAVKAGRFDLVLRALGGVWSACGVLWGSQWRSCGRVLKSAALVGQRRVLLKALVMTPLLTDERPQRPDARSREVGVGYTEDFADGSGGYVRK